MRQHWYAIKYLEWYQTGYTNPVGPVLVRAETIPGLVFWSNGPARTTLTAEQKPEILKDYGTVREGYTPRRRFFRDFPLEPTLENTVSDGWLSPQGEYYAVGFGQHSWAAERLVTQKRYIPQLSDAEDELYRRGWIAVHGGTSYISRDRSVPIKAAQVERFIQLSNANEEVARIKDRLDYAR